MCCRVLVVDDDAAFRGLAVRLVADLDLTVAGEAGTFAEGVAAAEELRPDAALVDVGLPDGDGVVLARLIAASAWRPRVVLTSSDPGVLTAETAASLGNIAFVAKTDLADGPLRALLTGVT
jgi:DNA-binding NarL/FixJ family response regulator